MEVFTLTDLTSVRYFLLVADGCFLAIEEMMVTEDSTVLIAVGELMVIVTGAIVSGPSWEGRMIFYVGDNQNVVTWLEIRRARYAYARFLPIL